MLKSGSGGDHSDKNNRRTYTEVMKTVTVVVMVATVTLGDGLATLGPVTTDQGVTIDLAVNSQGHTEALLRATRHDTLAFVTIEGTFYRSLDVNISKKDVLYILRLQLVQTLNGVLQWKLSVGQSSWVLASAVTRVRVGSEGPITWVVCTDMNGCAMPESEKPACTTGNNTTTTTTTATRSLNAALGAGCGVLLMTTVLLAVWLYRTSRRTRESDSPMERFSWRSDAPLLGATWDPALAPAG